MKIIPLLFCAAASAVLSMPVSAEVPDQSVRESIEQALDASAAAWTAGDLKKFMQLYENSRTIRYINADGIVIGYAAIQSKYAARFQKDGGAHMGKLSVQLIDVQEVGPQYAFVIGRYFLKPENGATVSGVTTLLFHKTAGHWHIVVDHTS